MNKDSRNTEELRSILLSDVYAGSCAGMTAMMLDESRIKNADADELERIAEEYDTEIFETGLTAAGTAVFSTWKRRVEANE